MVENKTLKEIVGKITTGKLDANAMNPNGLYKFFTCAKETYQIDTYAFDEEALLISGNGANVGYIHYYKGKFNAYQRTYVLSEFKDNIRYVQYALEGLLAKRIDKEKNSGSMPYIVLSTLTDMELPIPPLPEQQKIAEFFTLLDERISKQSEKIVALKDLKKGYIQRIFNQELRFKDDNGNEYPEWTKHLLNSIADCLDSKRKPLNSAQRDTMQGNIPYYGANSIAGYVNDYLFDEELVLVAEDGGYFNEYWQRPIAQYIKGKSWVNNHAHILRAKTANSKFLFYSLVHKDIRKYINGTSRAKLNKEDLLKIAMLVPSLPEQQKIADFLSTFDDKIEAEEKKLELLKEQKQGYMQRIFA